MIKYIGLLLFCFVALFSCKKDGETIAVEPNPPVGPTEPNEPEPGQAFKFEEGKSEYIFDANKLHTFELTLTPENLSRINNDPAAEEYVEGNLTFEGETVTPVGIRYKGSIGAFVGCLSNPNWADPSGFKTCTKLSMKIKINWEDSDRKFFGLKKLQFHAMNLDESQMRDRVGYHLFRSMGVPAPRVVHCRLVINGEYSGVYGLVEQIDGRFTRQNYDDGTGNLYKEIWPLNSDGAVFSEQTYLDALKTNEDENPTAEMISTFGQEIVSADESGLKSVIEKWMDVEEIISYAVVDRAIRNDDGAFHWYCSNGDCAPHNFYWYENPEDKTMHLIPWDLDNAFENIISNSNPVTPIADGWGETRNNCRPFRFGTFFAQQRSAACDKLTKGWTLFDTEYEQLSNEFKTGPLSAAVINALIDEWSDQIRDATIEARELHSDAPSMGEWEAAMQQLKNQLEFARNN